jgi:hypothetical protein
MKECEELRVVHMFLREATLTPFMQIPNYSRFMELSMNIFYFVGLGRAVMHSAKKVKQEVCENAVRTVAARILTQSIQQLVLEGVGSDRELRMRR